ncbi:MAG: acetamidase/formamidase family protein [Syntrophomonadaceae bacterium]|jgi:acetamidase/formamidase|nr:acetamidase/formamidase family protein [Syntrophomonadaceae bacterium]
MGKTHYCPDIVHYAWDNSLEPIINVSSGDTVIYEFRDAGDRQIVPGSTNEDIRNYDWDRSYPLNGPVHIKGAEPGDTLEIEILDLHTKGWGWTGVMPGFGLLNDEFTEAFLKVFEFGNDEFIEFREDIHIPVEPFLGIMGVAPAEPGKISSAPPDKHGSNMDIKHLTKGTRLLLPVLVPGALFSAGDGHAVQGDGEVCLTAVECPLYGALKFSLLKGKTIPGPQFITPPGSLTRRTESKGYYVTTGIGKDLVQCSKDALLAMIDHIVQEYNMSRYDAYVLCSLTLDLKISEIVDPNFVVSAYLPLNIFK